MKTVTVFLFSAFLFLGCNNSSKNQRIIPDSVGNINSLSIVAENQLWEGNVGETIRDILAAPLEGLPQDEPIFSMRQMQPLVFTDFARRNRTVLKIEKGKASGIEIKSDVYARPQTLIVISGETNKDIIEQLQTNSKKIIDAFTKEEIKEKQRRIKISLHKNTSIKEKMGLTLNFQSAYRIAKEEDNFFWIRKKSSAGSVDLMIYQVPIDAIRKGDSAVIDIVNIRNDIGKKHIIGENEGSYMITETAYAPYIFETIVDNKPAFETKGIWDMKNDIMSGPFINYAIEDKINNRYVILEGYAYAPSVGKRDYIFELEAIIKSVKIN